MLGAGQPVLPTPPSHYCIQGSRRLSLGMHVLSHPCIWLGSMLVPPGRARRWAAQGREPDACCAGPGCVGREAKQEEVKAAVKRMHVQLDNLCQVRCLGICALWTGARVTRGVFIPFPPCCAAPSPTPPPAASSRLGLRPAC